MAAQPPDDQALDDLGEGVLEEAWLQPAPTAGEAPSPSTALGALPSPQPHRVRGRRVGLRELAAAWVPHAHGQPSQVWFSSSKLAWLSSFKWEKHILIKQGRLTADGGGGGED